MIVLSLFILVIHIAYYFRQSLIVQIISILYQHACVLGTCFFLWLELSQRNKYLNRVDMSVLNDFAFSFLPLH